MDQSVQETCISVGRLAGVLNELADAMTAGDLDGMLAAEPRLAHLASALAALRPGAPPESDVLRSAILEARLALRRCERLGSGLATFIECSLAAQGRGAGYERHGLPHAPQAGRALTARG
jgi:hypothetical protein